MPELEFLKSPDQHYLDHEAAWEREENRIYGDDAVLHELTKFASEPKEEFELRQRTARYDNFPDLNAGLLSGHLRRKMPMPNLADLGGEPRTRDKIVGLPTAAELLWYNCDGIGLDGSQFPAWVDWVEKMAIATGLRYILIDMPTIDDLVDIRLSLGRDPGDPTIRSVLEVTDREKANGWRPFLVHKSPLDVTRALYEKGVLKYAVSKYTLPPSRVANDDGTLVPVAEGRLLMVRQGYQGLGSRFKQGGWWIFDENHEVVKNDQGQERSGRWELTHGQIPLVRAIAEPSMGTQRKPGFARSLTMMLGQIAIDLMNARSEQRSNARYAAKSINFFMGAGPDVQGAIVAQTAAGSIIVGVPPQYNEKTQTYTIPTLENSSAAALDSSVYEGIIQSAVEQAKDLMIKQLSSTPDASAVSKDAGFAEGSSPLLARLAATQEQWINSVLAFYAMRSGVEQPTASLTMPRDFDLRKLVDDVDAMLDTLRKSLLRSDSWTIDLLLRKGEELGLVNEKNKDDIRKELEDSAKQAADQAAQQADALAQLTRGTPPTPPTDAKPPTPAPTTPPVPEPIPAAA